MIDTQDYRQVFQQMTEDSLIPVIMQPLHEFLSYFRPDMKQLYEHSSIAGQFHDSRGCAIEFKYWDKFPNRFIYINPDLSSEEKIYVYLHETGHKICQDAHCSCRPKAGKVKRMVSEIHADLYAIEILTQKQYQNPLKRTIQILREQARIRQPNLSYYRTAAIKIMKTRTFKNALIFLEKGIPPEPKHPLSHMPPNTPIGWTLSTYVSVANV